MGNIIRLSILFLVTFSLCVVDTNGEEQQVCLSAEGCDYTPDDNTDTKVVYIIRHGEKQYDKSLADAAFAYKHACESEQGWGRAYHLISVFGNDNNPNTFRVPNALFSYNYDDSVNCRTSRGYFRTQATIAPLAEYLGIHINHLAFALGAPTENMKWDATDFDTVVALYFDVKTKKFIKFTKAKQGFEWIGPEMELPNID